MRLMVARTVSYFPLSASRSLVEKVARSATPAAAARCPASVAIASLMSDAATCDEEARSSALVTKENYK